VYEFGVPFPDAAPSEADVTCQEEYPVLLVQLSVMAEVVAVVE
jgi:hypothetical protein